MCCSEKVARPQGLSYLLIPRTHSQVQTQVSGECSGGDVVRPTGLQSKGAAVEGRLSLPGSLGTVILPCSPWSCATASSSPVLGGDALTELVPAVPGAVGRCMGGWCWEVGEEAWGLGLSLQRLLAGKEWI